MQAFHGSVKVKNIYLRRVKAHAQADEIIKGQYWENGKGCAVGCTIHGSQHSKYESELGIPEWLARVEDSLFEGMSNKKAKKWPFRFLKAIKPGADLEAAKAPFFICVLESVLTCFDHGKFPDVKKAVDGSIALWRRSDIGTAEWNKEAAAWAAAAARAAGWAAEAAAAGWAAEAAARAVSRAVSRAEAAGWAAGWAARAAARAAAWEAARAAAWEAVEVEKYNYFSNKLLEILSSIEPKR